MSRNYKKENEWLKENYCRIEGRVEKDFGNRFKLYLKSKNISFNEWLENKIKEDGIMKIVGKLLKNDKDLEIVEQNGEMYVLCGWNGESYCNCWKVLDAQGLNTTEEDKKYTLKPVIQGNGTQNKDGSYDEYKTIFYEIHIN